MRGGVLVRDLTRGTVLAAEAEVADTVFRRMKGLLGRAGLPPGGGMVIAPCASIHTFFMKFPIDVIFYGKDKKVLSVVRDLKPFRLSAFYPRAEGVIELPAGTLTEIRVEAGDLLEFRRDGRNPA